MFVYKIDKATTQRIEDAIRRIENDPAYEVQLLISGLGFITIEYAYVSVGDACTMVYRTRKNDLGWATVRSVWSGIHGDTLFIRIGRTNLELKADRIRRVTSIRCADVSAGKYDDEIQVLYEEGLE